jgi:hypothetical protein
MRKSTYLFAATLLGAATLVQPAAAQDFTSATFGGTTIWAGGGIQFLSLPDIHFTSKRHGTTLKRQDNTQSDWLDFGGSAGGGLETTLGYWGGFRVTGSVDGFWSGLSDSDRRGCKSGGLNCIVIDPTGANVFRSTRLNTKTNRDADYWGGKAALKFGTGAPTEVKPEIYRNDYFIVGFDVRGIDQDNKLHSSTGTVFTLRETIDTTYTGGYIGFGGEYSFGFIPGIKSVGGLYDRLGLRTFINATAGFYNANTDYTGRFTGPVGTRVSKSSDDFAFIGTVSLETRKQLGPRTSLSLWTDYEYISSVPDMHYAGVRGVTRIADDDVFATRTMLRLNIGLGSQQLYTGGGGY